MGLDPSESGRKADRAFSVLPDELHELTHLRQAIDPNWDPLQWIRERADEEMRMLEADLDRELLQLDMKKIRLEKVSTKLGMKWSGSDKNNDPLQTNLFDDFLIKINVKDGFFLERAIHIQESEHDIEFGEDDPFDTLSRRCIIQSMIEAEANGNSMTDAKIVEVCTNGGLTLVEIRSAIEHLLASGEIIEVNCEEYIMGDEEYNGSE